MDSENEITYIIPHTHWDREWYVPFQYFRFRLVEIMDNLINILQKDENYKFFNLDGQTIVLEDYLQIKPENEDILKQLIQAGRIGIGPWYLQSSPWLQTGEGIVRNLQEGVEICDKFGTKPVNVGWVPDQFIHPPQFPQIYQNFGIEHTAFSRGIGNQYEDVPGLNCEFEWEGLDGSKVTAFHLQSGYGLNANLDNYNPTQAINQIAMDLGQLAGHLWSTSLHLAFAGSDHCGPDFILPEVIEMWNDDEDLLEELGKIQMVSWNEYLTKFNELKPELKIVQGELWGRKYQITLHGVFSSYINLKQRSFHIHNLLERWAEPFSAISQSHKLPDMTGYLKESWKWLLKNQPHDSSWTSSVDQVQKEMDTRFDWAEQMAIDVYRRSLQWIIQHLNNPDPKRKIALVVYNPLPWVRSELVTARFANRLNSSNLQLVNLEGMEITHQIQGVEPGDEDRLRRRVYVGSHGGLGKDFREVKFVAENIPAMGYKTYFIQERNQSTEFQPPEEGLLDGNDYYLENDVIRVVVEPNGSVTAMLKENIDVPGEKLEIMGEELGNGSIWAGENSYKYPGLHLYEDTSDAGDGWEYRPTQEAPILSFGDLDEKPSILLEASDFGGTIIMKRKLYLPRALDEDHATRSKDLAPLEIVTYISIEKGSSPIIKIKTELENIIKDHRLRVVFPTNLHAKDLLVNGHFGSFYRSIEKPDGKGWHRPPEMTFPFHKFIDLWDKDKKHGLAIFSKGIPEYEAIPSESGVSLALSLVRSTGYWGTHIGVTPPVSTPRAQLYQEKLQFEYAIVPHNVPAQDMEESLMKLAEEYYTPLKWEEDYDTYRYKVQKPDKILPLENSYLELEGNEIYMSSLQNHKKGVYIRIYNDLNTLNHAKIKFGALNVKNIIPCSLNFQPDNGFKVDFNQENQEVDFDLGSKKIISLKLEL